MNKIRYLHKLHKLNKRIKVNNLQHIGMGGYGKVYIGYYNSEKVSIKNIENMGKICEITNIKKLKESHKHNIIEYKAYYNNNQLVYKYYQYCLFDLDTNITINQQKTIILSILKAIRYLYVNKLQHNDIHEGNILLDEDYNAYLCDFGNTTRLDINYMEDLTRTLRLFATNKNINIKIKNLLNRLLYNNTLYGVKRIDFVINKIRYYNIR